MKALGQLKNGKAPGSFDVLPEMLKVEKNNPDFVTMLNDLFHEVWKNEQVPQEWGTLSSSPYPRKAIYAAVITGEGLPC